MEWIRASERLPEKPDQYFVYVPALTLKRVATFNGKHFERMDEFTLKDFEWLSEGDGDRDAFAIAFAAWAMFSPDAEAYRAAGISAQGLLEKYKSRPYINPDTTSQ